MRCESCRNRLTIHFKSKQQLPILLGKSRHITNIEHITVSGYSAGRITYNNFIPYIKTGMLCTSTQDTGYFYLSPQGSTPVRRELPATTRGCSATSIHLLWTITYEMPILTTVAHTNRQHCPIVTRVLYDYCVCNGFRDWIINKHFRNSEHHLLSSMSSGEHPLRVDT